MKRMFVFLIASSLVSVGAYAALPVLFPAVLPLIASVGVGGAGTASVPQEINHQGVITVTGARFNGDGHFYFALVDSAGTNLWTNDSLHPIGSTGRPTNAVHLGVTNGVYSVRLGGTEPDPSDPSVNLYAMPPIPPSVFNNDDVRLRIWFDDLTINGIQQLSPDQPLTTSPYAFRADFANAVPAGAGAIPGEIRMWAGPFATIPDGWHVCNGDPIPIADNLALYEAIGKSWGGDGVGTFNLPDLRGRFVRGVSMGFHLDPDRVFRGRSRAGGNTGDAVGSVQGEQYLKHRHGVTDGQHGHDLHMGRRSGGHIIRPSNGDVGEFITNSAIQKSKSNISINDSGGKETRPDNAYVYFIIKL